MYTIYKITNLLNNKKYIGQTMRPVKQRWSEHVRERDDSPIHRAIKKYGKDNFKFEIIETVETPQQADEREQYWIEYYKTAIPKYGNEYGYNLTLGGEGTLRISDTQKQFVLSLWNQNKNITQISEIAHIDRHGVSNILHDFGIPESEFIQRRYVPFHTIYVYDIQGNLINTFDTLQEALMTYTDINKTQIGNVLHHKLASTHHLIFLYQEDINQLANHLKRSHVQHRGAIKATNILTKEAHIYDSITQAQNQTKIDRHTIRNRINNAIIIDNIYWEDIYD